MLSRAGLCTSGATAAAAAAARPTAPRLTGPGALRQALQFRGLRGAALAPAQLRALGMMRGSAASRQAMRVSAVAAPAEVRLAGGDYAGPGRARGPPAWLDWRYWR